MRIKQFKHEFVHRVPKSLDEGVLYVCIECNIAMHKCACGCGEKVATPIEKNQWKVVYNGESVSLSPSIGNWSYRCQSHYFIREDRVEWAGSYSDCSSQEKQAKSKPWLKRLFKR